MPLGGLSLLISSFLLLVALLQVLGPQALERVSQVHYFFSDPVRWTMPCAPSTYPHYKRHLPDGDHEVVYLSICAPTADPFSFLFSLFFSLPEPMRFVSGTSLRAGYVMEHLFLPFLYRTRIREVMHSR